MPQRLDETMNVDGGWLQEGKVLLGEEEGEMSSPQKSLAAQGAGRHLWLDGSFCLVARPSSVTTVFDSPAPDWATTQTNGTRHSSLSRCAVLSDQP